jgi:hypothetical protein
VQVRGHTTRPRWWSSSGGGYEGIPTSCQHTLTAPFFLVQVEGMEGVEQGLGDLAVTSVAAAAAVRVCAAKLRSAPALTLRQVQMGLNNEYNTRLSIRTRASQVRAVR